MEATEVMMHCRKMLLQATDRPPARRIFSENGSQFPTLPSPRTASEAAASSLRQNAEAVMQGDWTFFGHHLLKVDDPPRWHCDYLAGIDVSTRASGFNLNHRELPSGADIKLVWELSRWHHLARLAQAGWFFEEERFAAKCVEWLEDWVKCNPPYAGWNWTSALESGLRLIQLREKDWPTARRDALAQQLVPLAHRFGAKVLLNGMADDARRLGCDGVHWTASDRAPPRRV